MKPGPLQLVLGVLWGVGTSGCRQVSTIEHGSAVERALLAQSAGLGGCDLMTRLDTVSIEFHPEVTFIEGTCLLEHGDTAHPLVAVDRGGQVYLLDSPSAFAFMIRTHPPPHIPRAGAVEYAAIALRMMGKLAPEDRVVESSSEISDSLLSALGASRHEFWDSSYVLKELARGYEVALVALGPGGIKSAVGLVYADSGSVHMVVEQRGGGTGRR